MSDTTTMAAPMSSADAANAIKRLIELGRWQPYPMLRGDSYGDDGERQESTDQMDLFA